MNSETEKVLASALGENEKTELDELRRDKKIKENLERELEMLREVFGTVDADDIPDELFDKCEEGKGLAGEYALWYVKTQKEKETAEKKNASNSSSALPEINDGDGELYFTPEQVKTMSRKDVRRHYKSIMKSMEKWK